MMTQSQPAVNIKIIFGGTVLEIKLEGRKEGNILFNDALNTFHLRLYAIGNLKEIYKNSKRIFI